jgi:spore germination protein YaaH
MRPSHNAPTRRRVLALAAAPLVMLLGSLLPGAAGATTAVAAGTPDPRGGVHSMQAQQFGAPAPRQAADPHMLAGGTPSSRAAVRTSTASASVSATSLNKEVFGFAPYWELPNWHEWQLNLVSTLAYFSVSYDANGAPEVNNSNWTGWQSQNLTDLVNATHAAGHKVVLTITAGGGNTSDTVWSIVSDPAKSAAAINSAVSLMHQRGMDGIAIDMEGTADSKYPGIQGDFTNFVHNMQNALNGASLFVATYSGSASWTGGIFNIHDLAPYVTAFFIMAYDMAPGNESGTASPNAPLGGSYTYNDTLSVSQYIQQSGDPAKVILGVPYYGAWWNVSSGGPHAPVTSGMHSDTYAGMFPDFLNCSCASQWQNGWDDPGATPWTSWWDSGANTRREMYYDNVQSLAAKYDLINNNNIRGVGIWALGYDTGRGELWGLIAEKFGPNAGYWMGATDGGVFSFGRAKFHGSMGGTPLNQPVVGMAPTPSTSGYWLVASDGGIFSFGDAAFYGSTGAMRLNKPVVGMASTPAGRGYWLVASDGGIFTFGDGTFHGSTGSIRLNQPIVGMAATPSGLGYWLVASDGGIFAFGDAAFYGSTGAMHLNQPVVGMAATPSGQGYWLVASDGGIFSFGDATFHGSTGSMRLNQPIVGMASTATGNGYWMVASDGGLFTFGDGAFLGSMGGQRLARPVVAMAAPGFQAH